MKLTHLYLLAIAMGLSLLVYFYLFNFDAMSETQLVNSVLYWYVPLIFGVYGIIAARIKSKIKDPQMSAVTYLFSGKDGLLLFLIIFIGCGGLLGLVLLLVPLALLKVSSPHFDLKVALFGTLLCLGLLWVFFNLIWPAL